MEKDSNKWPGSSILHSFASYLPMTQVHKGYVRGWSLKESGFLFCVAAVVVFTVGLGVWVSKRSEGSLTWEAGLGWITCKLQPGLLPGYADQPKWPGSNAGWLASWPLVLYSNPGGIQGLTVSRQEEALTRESKEMSKVFLCKCTLSQPEPPTYIQPSRDTGWDQVGALDPLTM